MHGLILDTTPDIATPVQWAITLVAPPVTTLVAWVLTTALIEHPGFLNTRFVLCRHGSRSPTVPAQAFMIALQREFAALDAEVSRLRKRR